MDSFTFFLEGEGILYTRGFSLKKYFAALGIKRFSQLSAKAPSIALEVQLGGLVAKAEELVAGDFLVAGASPADAAAMLHLVLDRDRVTNGVAVQTLAQLRAANPTLTLFRAAALEAKSPAEIAAAFAVPPAAADDLVLKAFFGLHTATWRRAVKDPVDVIRRWVGHIQLGSQRHADGFFRVRLTRPLLAACASLGLALTLPPVEGSLPERWAGALAYVGHLH